MPHTHIHTHRESVRTGKVSVRLVKSGVSVQTSIQREWGHLRTPLDTRL